MNKAKIMLSAIALFAVVGAAFALKASRDPHPFFYKTTTDPLVKCLLPADISYTTVGITTTTIPYTTTNTTTNCIARVLETI